MLKKKKRMKRPTNTRHQVIFPDLWNPELLGATFNVEVEETKTADPRQEEDEDDVTGGVRGYAVSIPEGGGEGEVMYRDVYMCH